MSTDVGGAVIPCGFNGRVSVEYSVEITTAIMITDTIPIQAFFEGILILGHTIKKLKVSLQYIILK
jgi:hypothetical protein